MTMILVSSANWHLRKLIVGFVEGCGIKTCEANQLEETRAKCVRYQLDGIFLDWDLPILEGPQFLRELPSLCPAAMPKVIVLADAKDTCRAGRLAERCGAADYIPKSNEFYSLDTVRFKLKQCGLW